MARSSRSTLGLAGSDQPRPLKEKRMTPLLSRAGVERAATAANQQAMLKVYRPSPGLSVIHNGSTSLLSR